MAGKGDNKQDQLKAEEQQVLDQLIREIDKQILIQKKGITAAQLKHKKATSTNLAEAYADIMHENYQLELRAYMQQELYRVRDALYDTRIVVDVDDVNNPNGNEHSQMDIKIGLHALNIGGEIYVESWTMPISRHYLLDDSAVDYRGKVKDKYEDYFTDYHLLLKRKVEIGFDKVRKVVHMYPLADEEAEQIVSDDFLQELLKRRTEREFQNIVFSIQKKQGAIIQRPYETNLIVQGCAGSGKSMIMMHRLPILIFDNPNELPRNSIYIITPSMAYIQMAEHMRIDLEIADLQMGTMNQYYEYILGKYGIALESCGRIKSKDPLTPDEVHYVYSQECIRDIGNDIAQLFQAGYYDLSSSLAFYRLNEDLKKGYPRDIIRKYAIATTHIMQKNREVLREYRGKMTVVGADLEDIHRMLRNRKLAIERGISQRITGVQKNVNEQKDILAKTNRLLHPIAYQNRQHVLEDYEKQLMQLRSQLVNAQRDEDYYARLNGIDDRLAEALHTFPGLQRLDEDWRLAYSDIQDIPKVDHIYDLLEHELYALDEKYLEYTDSLINRLSGIRVHINALRACNTKYLPYDEYERIVAANTYYDDLGKTLYDKVYRHILSKVRESAVTETDSLPIVTALECSPYLYARIAYMCQGAPSGKSESLISIDEAQNLAPVELQLIRDINNKKVVFNLYGDVHQHMEGSKGVDRWSDFAGIIAFEQHDLNENYRNAAQITEYCNKYFHMNMQAINLAGSGVHILPGGMSGLDRTIKQIMTGAAQPGNRAIIVHTPENVTYVMNRYEQFKGYLNDMTTDGAALSQNAWNVMTVSQAKGLEFKRVIVLSYGMTRNERYIAYTRALDELYIYEARPETLATGQNDVIVESAFKESGTVKKRQAETRTTTPKRQNPARTSRGDGATSGQQLASSPVREYFERQGLEVKDLRSELGCLWVVGTRAELEPYVRTAMKEYRVTGKFIDVAAPIGNRAGWYTKSKG